MTIDWFVVVGILAGVGLGIQLAWGLLPLLGIGPTVLWSNAAGGRRHHPDCRIKHTPRY